MDTAVFFLDGAGFFLDGAGFCFGRGRVVFGRGVVCLDGAVLFGLGRFVFGRSPGEIGSVVRFVWPGSAGHWLGIVSALCAFGLGRLGV